MNKQNKFSLEVKERAVRLIQKHRGEYPGLRGILLAPCLIGIGFLTGCLQPGTCPSKR